MTCEAYNCGKKAVYVTVWGYIGSASKPNISEIRYCEKHTREMHDNIQVNKNDLDDLMWITECIPE